MKSATNSAPHSTTTAPISCPNVNGQGNGFGQWPLRMCRSVPQTPQAPIWSTAAFLGTDGQATLRITGAAPGPSKVATRIALRLMLTGQYLPPRPPLSNRDQALARIDRTDASVG